MEDRQHDKIADELKAFGGVFTLEVIRDGKNGPEVIQRRDFHNLVVNTGKSAVWKVAGGLNTSIFDRMRIGTSASGAPTSVQTNLLSPIASTLTVIPSITMSGRTFQLVRSYISGAGSLSAAGIKEVGIFNRATTPGGSMLARGTFTAVNKTTSDKLKITYQVRIT